MDFLNSLAKGVYNTVNKVGSAIGSGLSSASSMLGNAFSGATNALGITGPLNQSPYGPQPAPEPVSYWKVSDSPAGQISTNIDTGAWTTYDNKTGTVGTTHYNTTPQQYANNIAALNPRPSTWTAPVDQYGRTSSSSQGVSYIDAQGNRVTPQTGFSGLSGTGGVSGLSSPSQITGSQGLSGLGGGSAYTGLLGAAGSGGQTSIQGQGDEQQRKKQENINKGVKVVSYKDNPDGTTTNFLSDGTISIVRYTQNPDGSLSPREVGGTQVANIPASLTGAIPSPEITAPNFDLNQLTTSRDNIQKYLTNPKAMSQADLETTLSQLQTDFTRIKGQYDQTHPVPPNPVVDTPEQDAFLQNSPDPFGVKQLMDEYRAANTNLSQLEGQRIDVQKQILALNDAYKPIIDDIKNNPDLPKGLAQRRLNLLQEQQKKVLQGFLDQQTVLTQQISDQNQTVNRAFNIVQNAQSQEEKARDNARQNLSLFVQSGAVGGFTAQDIKQYAQTTGISISVIQKMVSTAKTPKIDAIYKENANGDVTAIDQNTGKVLWVAKGVGTPSTSAGTNPQVQDALNQLMASRNIGPEADGQYADPNLYATLRAQSKISATDFDNKFGYLVNPASRAKLGIGTSSTADVPTVNQLTETQRGILNNAKATIDAAKQQYRYTPELRQSIINMAQQQYGFNLANFI